jgi:nucleobase:cation symporter-1, NCS1 family
MFISPLAGINAVDFWIIRRRRWNVPALYIGDNSSIYWYSGGFNLRAFAAWSLSIWPSFPGFVMAVGGATIKVTWLRLFQTSWFIGFLGGALVYFLISLVLPPPGKPYEVVQFGNEGHGTIFGNDVLGEKGGLDGGSSRSDEDYSETKVAPKI